MSKTILLINSSFKKGNTYNILLQIENLLKDNGISTEIINLFDYKIDSCLGCQKCIATGSCCINDDASSLMQKMLNSDGIVISSPVYIENISGKLKTFVDRTCEWYHTPKLAGKPVLYVTTATATGIKQTKQAFKSISISWGTPQVGMVTRTERELNQAVTISEIKDFISILRNGNHAYSPSFHEINIFQVQKVMAIKSKGYDNEYWESHRLTDMVYYYDCKLNFIKKLFSKSIFNILMKVMG